jgi:prepilin-type N-terminal cleavage/methylation domain-containing protein
MAMKTQMRRKGMTLVEVVVGIAIIAIILVAMVSGFMTMSGVKVKADEFTKADKVLEDAIANGSYTSADNKNLTLPGSALPGEFSGVTIPGKVYTYKDPDTGKSFKLVGKA